VTGFEEEDESVHAVIKDQLRAIAVVVLLIAAGLPGCSWKQRLSGELQRFGHRNWIVVADSAYPCQSRRGIETVAVGGDQIEAVRGVLDAVDRAAHVRPVVYLDAELPAVAEEDAPGVEAYRNALDKLLEGRSVRDLPHEAIIARLDEAAKTFNVLIIKTNMTLPYTSVFIELDCGYWSKEAEERLRKALPW
jgi:hypothetical protein